MIVIMLLSNADEFIDEIHEAIIKRYDELENGMKGSGFSSNFIHTLYIACETVNAPQGASLMASPNWLGYKNILIKPKNNDDKCFQYALARTQYYEEIENNSQ